MRDAETVQIALPIRAFCTLNETPDLIRHSHAQSMPLALHKIKAIRDIVGDKTVARFAAMTALGW